jgi:hypothetical protein
MAANAATKARRVSYEPGKACSPSSFMTAAQALEFRRPLRSGTAVETVLERYRQVVPELEADRIISDDMERTRLFLREGSVRPAPCGFDHSLHLFHQSVFTAFIANSLEGNTAGGSITNLVGIPGYAE